MLQLEADIVGAFDKVSHVGVLHKLRAYGIDGTLHRWLTSYLPNRNFQAVVGGATSQAFPVTAGVPQGSILGPILFIVYVNDVPDVLPTDTVPATYADDTTLFSLIPSIVDLPARCTEFQSAVHALSEWGSTWRVKFEPSKSQATTISRHLCPWQIPSVKFDGVTSTEEVNSLRFLGVTFDKTLSVGQHLRSVAVRAAQQIGFLRKAPAVVDIPGRLTTYKGFVRPLMEYSPLVWSGAAACHLSRFDRIQRRALSFLGPSVIVDSLELRRTISGRCLLYKLQLMCGPRSPCLLPLLPRQAHHTTHPHKRQQAQVSSGHNLQFSLTLPPRSNNTILCSFPHALIPTWNSLTPSILHEQPHLRHLQRATYRYLRKNDWLWATQTYV